MLRIFASIILTSIFILVGCNGPDSNSVSASSPVSASPEAASNEIVLNSDYEKLSYGLGKNIGMNISRQGVPELNADALVAGLRDAISGRESLITEDELSEIAARIRKHEIATKQEMSIDTLNKGSAFLEKNGARKGVITTESGLQYEILTAGKGPSPSAKSVVNTHYHGTLIDGTVFDSSVERGEPIEFPVNGVILGWTEALQLMKKGSKWRLYIPENLAYGEDSPSAHIPPRSTLIFDVELLSFDD